MIDKYKDELLQSFLDNYSRVYLIDLEKDTIVKIQESEDAPELDPVRQKHYSEFNRVYSYTMLEPEYSQWEVWRISEKSWQTATALRCPIR